MQSETPQQSNIRQAFKQALIESLSADQHESQIVTCEQFVVIFVILFAVNRFPSAPSHTLIADINEAFFVLVPVNEQERLAAQLQEETRNMKLKQREQRALQAASLLKFHEEKALKDAERKRLRREKAQQILDSYPELERVMRVNPSTGSVQFADHIPMILPPLAFPVATSNR